MKGTMQNHQLALGGAHHLAEAGIITPAQRDAFQATARSNIASTKPVTQGDSMPRKAPAPAPEKKMPKAAPNKEAPGNANNMGPRPFGMLG